jgi:signal transduction histidine kinase
MFGTHRDITERKEAQLELEKYRHKLEIMVHERTKELLQANEELNSANEELHVTNEMLAEKKAVVENTLKKLQKMQAQLIQSEKMASLGILVAGIAHEINNPVNFISSGVTGIKTNIELLIDALGKLEKSSRADNEQTPKKMEQTIEMLMKALSAVEIGVERTVTIVSGLRSFARADENVVEKADIHKLIDNTLLILFNQYKNRIGVKKEYGKVPLLDLYVGQINQMLMNVLSNAIQAIENQGLIIIKTKVVKQKLILSIKDNGQGMDEQTKLKIFDPFFTTKKVGQGTGLGLSISYNIIKKHDGNIQVESVLNKGTEFIITLPLKQVKTMNN